MDPCCCRLRPDAARGSLRKCFRDLRERHEAWKRTLAACAPLLASLANLAEQGQSLRRAGALGGPGANPAAAALRPFPDLPERLRSKQSAAGEALLERLHQEALQELREVRDAISARVSRVSLLCDQLGEGQGWAKVAFQRSASCPSVADMLEWLLDVEGFYHRTFLEAKFLLLQVRGEDLAGMQALPEAWAQVLQHSQESLVEDVLLKVSFFLEEAT